MMHMHMQTAPGVFKESTFRALDYVLHTAAKNDVRCVRVLFYRGWASCSTSPASLRDERGVSTRARVLPSCLTMRGELGHGELGYETTRTRTCSYTSLRRRFT